MVWAVEKTIPAPDGRGRSGVAAGRETRAYLRASGRRGTGRPYPRRSRTTRRSATTSWARVPEHWIPFVPCAPRQPARDPAFSARRSCASSSGIRPPVPVRPRTSLLRSASTMQNWRPIWCPKKRCRAPAPTSPCRTSARVGSTAACSCGAASENKRAGAKDRAASPTTAPSKEAGAHPADMISPICVGVRLMYTWQLGCATPV